ncbi:PREDICTED: NADH-cytochrome b5 reductase-like isoform X2 [Nanorana parkeri]|uniref:NADH-cytochrome b5 reductase-like isoform X2 n=1 Tax=Nanorana parkeri TaxID=125878 RepID=UPI0008549824|nr:PREDICTED: NADH-cytochrome b5 reductase-like isoform X2 [Nanorana parkeri]
MCDSGDTDWLSLRPVEPCPDQCCGGGCSPCVYDLYQAELELWEKAKERGDPQLLRRANTENPSVLLSSEDFREFTIFSVEQETEDTSRYRFQLPPGASLELNLGQHLVVRGRVNGLDIQRAYTPISSINAKGYFDVLIKIYEHGLMSQYIRSWRERDSVSWRGPFGGFPYKANKFGELLMLCSGTGLAPMIPILTSVTDNEDDETFITLVFCCRTFKCIHMKSFLQEQARFWNVRLFYVFSQEGSLQNLPMSYKENSKIGRINSTFLEMVLDTCRRKPYALICGSASFTEDMVHMVNELGHNNDSIFSF